MPPPSEHSGTESGTARPHASRFRHDVHGVRGLAILLVVAYHVHLPPFGGGFVGVDVFFVLSGFLITGLLIEEFRTTGRIDLLEFYARRARRLLPAAAVVFASTMVAAALLLSPLEQLNLSGAALATALYVSNLYFLREATDYLAAPPEGNPFLHTWSLSVEEQFYLVWPTVFLLIASMLRDRRRWPIAVVLVAAASFALGVWLTATAQPWAFFGSPARVWEFAAGALAAMVPAAVLGRRPLLSEVCVGAGLLMIGAAAVSFGTATSFPGVAAAVPVTGTVLVLIGGSTARGTAALLRTRPMQWFGDVSYVWYLWHWPVLVFAAAIVPGLGLPGRLWCGLASLLLAALTRATLEDRVRFAPRLVARPALSVALAGAVTIAAVAGAGTWRAAARDTATTAEHARFSGARDDNPVIYSNGCHLDYQDVEPPECAFGRRGSPVTVVLFGDSHAAHWFPALEAVASTAGWRLVSLTKSGCPSVDIVLRSGSLGRRYTECEAWRRVALARIRALRPDLVVLANASDYVDPASLDRPGGGDDAQSGGGVRSASTRDWLAGLRRTLRQVAGHAAHTVLLRDSPRPGFDVPTCLARAASRPWLFAEECRFEREGSVRADIVDAETRAAAELENVRIVDLGDSICDHATCETERSGVVMFRDHHHLTAAFSVMLAPAFAEQLQGTVATLRAGDLSPQARAAAAVTLSRPY